jgi:hypothetical protein
MKTFFTLTVAFVLGYIAALSLVGCSSDPTNVPIPSVNEAK